MADVKIRVCDMQDTHGDLIFAEERRTIRLDGTTTTVDLCTEHNEQFQKAINLYVDHARRLGGRRRGRSRRA